MFISPDSKELISGRPGRSALIQIGTLRGLPVKPPEGFGMTNAEFSPDGGHVALTIVDPKKKQGAVFITDDKLGSVQSLPAGTQFLRWLEKDRILLTAPDGLISHSVAGGEDSTLGRPEGRTGNAIPGTQIQFSLTEDGRIVVKNGTAPAQEVLRAGKGKTSLLRSPTTYRFSEALTARSGSGCNKG